MLIGRLSPLCLAIEASPRLMASRAARGDPLAAPFLKAIKHGLLPLLMANEWFQYRNTPSLDEASTKSLLDAC
jgi:hypothetical protein